MRTISAYLAGVTMGIAMFWIFLFLNIVPGISILFYKGIVLIGLTFVVQLGLLIFVFQKIYFKANCATPHAISISAICLALNMSFFIVVPVSLDRSISVFLLGYMYERGTDVTKQELEAAFNDIYVHQYEAIERRIQEQIASKNISNTGAGTYALTDMGANFIEFSRFTAKAFGISDRYLSPPVKKE